jgi:regulatory protein
VSDTDDASDPGEGSGPRRGRGRRRSARGGSRAAASGDDAGRGPDGPTPGTPADASPPSDPEDVARTICLRLLTGAPKTRAQLAEALRKRDVPDEVAARVLDRLTDVRLVDDEAFAHAWVESRHRGRGLARRALAHELRRRGVDDDTVDEAVETLDTEQEVETARALVRRRLPSTARLEPQARTRRLVGMLARKGYSSGVAFRVVREEVAGEGDEPGEPDMWVGDGT